MTNRFLLPPILLLLAAVTAAGQPKKLPPAPEKPPRYERLPFSGNVEDIVQDQLDWAKELEPLKGLVEQMLRDPKKFQIDPDSAKGLNLNNPALRRALQ